MGKANTIPTICIVGRPNVGKSSLFNCLLGHRRAVVVEQSGTTRDMVEGIVDIGSLTAKIIDTGGFASQDKDEISLQVKEHIYRAMEEASIVLMIVDTIEGITSKDEEVATLLRKSSKPVILVANKTDNDKLKNEALEFYSLGFGDPESISCLHRRGLRSLKQRITDSVEVAEDAPPQEDIKYLKIAIVGRPNVGKSSFVNNMLKRERVIVSDIPGTTRDSIDTFFTFYGKEYMLIDTAGIRHQRKVKEVVDSYSMMRSKGTIKRADITVLILDAVDGATRDDIDILRYIEQNGKACLIVINKWDLAEEVGGVTMAEYEKHLVYASSEIGKFPHLFISAKTGKNVIKSLEMINVLDANLDHTASTAFLNKIFEGKDPSQVPIPRSKKKPNFLYVVQSGTRPVEFKYFVNDPRNVLPAHMSFIENLLRANLPLTGIPIKINIRGTRKERK